jgi:cytochrome d ubiquinol oxidase subunit II
LLAAVTTAALFAMHGCLYLHLKTEGALQARVRGWIRPCILLFIVSCALLAAATLVFVPRAAGTVRDRPILLVLAALSILAIANIPREVSLGRIGRAFISSCATVVFLLALFGLSAFPVLVYSNPDPQHSLDVYNASSSQKTLGIMLIIAAAGMPLVVAYTASVYWIFRGKVKIEQTSY